MRAPSTAVRVATVYSAVCLSLGVHTAFFPVFLEHRGLGATEISLVLALPMALRVVSAPFLGMLSDQAADRRRVFAVCALGAAIGFSFLAYVSSFTAVFLVMAATALFWNAGMPLADSIATTIARRGLGDFGRMRLWGSIAFVLGNLIAGVLIGPFSPEIVFWLILGALCLQFSVSFVAPFIGRSTDPDAAQSGLAAARSGFGALLGNRYLMTVLIGTSVLQASHGMAYTFGSLLWGSQGHSGAQIALFWTVAVLSEILFFSVSGWFIRRLGAEGLILVGAAVATLRWLAFSQLESAPAWMLLQASHAFTFGAVYIGTMHIVVRSAPERLTGSAQGLYVTVNALIMSVVMALCGPIYRVLGASGFLVMSGIAVAGIAIVVAALAVIGRPSAQPHSAGSGGNTSEPS